MAGVITAIVGRRNVHAGWSGNANAIEVLRTRKQGCWGGFENDCARIEKTAKA